ncbi:MAG: DUF4097 family beta strand repeat-containing protein [Bacteroidota bacterium]
MKNVTSILIAGLAFVALNGQTDYTKSLNGIAWVKIESKAEIILKTHDSNQLLIKSEARSERPERAKGLKLVSGGGTDNTDVGFSVIQDGNNLIVKNLRKSDRAEIYLPASQNVSVKTTWHGDVTIEGFSGEIEADAQLNGGIEIINVTGPVTANALNGDVEVVFTSVRQTSPTSIYTTNGAVDITMPANTTANLSLSTRNGEVYTNFDLKRPQKNGLTSISSKSIKGEINSGGVSIKLKSTNGNIYLRKK